MLPLSHTGIDSQEDYQISATSENDHISVDTVIPQFNTSVLVTVLVTYILSKTV